MPDIERIDSYLDMSKIAAEHAQFEKFLEQDTAAIVELYSSINQFQTKSNVGNIATNWDKVSVAMTGVTTTSSALMQIQQQLNEQIAKTNALQKQLDDALAKGTTARKTRKNMTDEELTQSVRESESMRQKIALIKAQDDAYKSLDYVQKQADASAKSLQAKALQTGSPEDKAAADDASAKAKMLRDQLVGIDRTTGDPKRLIGTYTDALKPLEEELQKINAQIAEMDKLGKTSGGGVKNLTSPNPIGFDVNKNKPSGVGGVSNFITGTDTTEYQKLTQQAQALNLILTQQKEGFTSVTQQIRTTERALQTMEAVGLGATEGFDKLRMSTNSAAQAQKEFLRQERLLESEAPLLGALTLAAKSLAGAYAIGAGAAALFAEGNEKVQKEVNKLIAIMTILQGLEEAYRLIQQAGAIAAEFRKANLKYLTAATQLYADVTGEAVVATESLDAALIGSGLGAVIVAVAVAAGLLIAKIIELNTADEKAIKMQKELADATKELNQTIQDEIDLLGRSNEDHIRYLKEELTLMEAQGLNKEKEFGLRVKISDLENDQSQKAIAHATQIAMSEMDVRNSVQFQLEKKRELANLNDKLKKNEIDLGEYIKQTGEINARVNDNKITSENALQASRDYHLDQYNDKLRKVQEYQEITDEYIAKGKSTSIPDAIKDKLAMYKSQAAEEKDAFDKANELVVKGDDMRTQRQELQKQIEKFNLDERRKYILESANIEIALEKQKNQIILGDDRSTLDDRLRAIQNNAIQERRAIEATKNNVLSDSGSSDIDKQLAIKTAAEKEIELARETEESKRKLKYQYYVLDRDAQVEIFNLEKQDIIKRNEDVLSEDKTLFRQRLELQLQNYEARRAVLGSQLIKDLDKQGLDKEQVLAIEKKYESDLLELNLSYGKIRQDEEKKEAAKILKNWQDYYDQRKDQITENEVNSINDLNDRLSHGKIGVNSYNDKRKELEFQSAKEIAMNQITQDEQVLNSKKYGSKEYHDAELKMAQDTFALSDLIAKHEIDNLTKVTELKKQAAQEVKQAVIDSINGGFEREIQNIDRQLKKNDELKEQNTKRIQQSTLDEQQKAAAIMVIDKQADLQKQSLEKREKTIKIQEARFDRDVSVAETIEQGAVAAIAALKLPPPFGEAEAIAIGIITAAKVAEILSRPLPTYGFGTIDHPGGPAVIGDRYVRELIVEPGRSPRWSAGVPTVETLAPHTQVFNPEQIQGMMQSGMFVNKYGNLVQGNIFSQQRDNSASKIVDGMVWQTDRFERAIAKQSKVVIVNTKIDTTWGSYINTNIFDKR